MDKLENRSHHQPATPIYHQTPEPIPPYHQNLEPTPPVYHRNQASPFQVTPAVLKTSMLGCRSRKNLAGRLAAKIFSEEEMLSSNFRGVCNKKLLDECKTDAIRRACFVEFPFRAHENEYIVERDIREGVDEMGRRLKRRKIIGLGKENFNVV